jgi:anti-anti-sigma factor
LLGFFVKLTVEKEGSTLTISLEGRMDALACPDFDQGVGELLAQGERRFVIDLARLEYISSAGLRSLLQLSKAVDPDGGRVVLCGPAGVVQEVLEISGFGHIFTICANLDEARQSFL